MTGENLLLTCNIEWGLRKNRCQKEIYTVEFFLDIYLTFYCCRRSNVKELLGFGKSKVKALKSEQEM